MENRVTVKVAVRDLPRRPEAPVPAPGLDRAAAVVPCQSGLLFFLLLFPGRTLEALPLVGDLDGAPVGDVDAAVRAAAGDLVGARLAAAEVGREGGDLGVVGLEHLDGAGRGRRGEDGGQDGNGGELHVERGCLGRTGFGCEGC